MLVWFVACGPKIDVGPVPVERWAAPVTVLTEADPGAEEIRLSAMVRAGSGFDPIGREGLAWLVAHTLADDDLETAVDTEWVTFDMACPAPEATRCIERFVGALTTFHPRRWENHRERALGQPATALDALHQVLFEGHRTGHPRSGWPSVLPSLTSDEGRAFHATHYRRSTVLAGVVGSESVADALREALTAVPGGAPADDAWMRPPSPSSRRLFVVPRAPEAPAEVVFGQVARIGPDDPAMIGLATAMAGLEAELAAAEAAVELARQSLGAREEAISSLLGRAMAYLRVYAAEDPALLAQLDELVPKRRATRRGRRRRDSSPDGAKAVRPADQAREVAQAG
ncbi:MAG: hypothetical protein AAF211_18695, partial [Myxococcota bacterium]